MYISLNGKLFPADQPVLSAQNRAFRYGDALFETMHAAQNEIQFFDAHFNRLHAGMKLLKMNIPINFRPSYIKKEINRLTNKNKLYKGARIRFSVFRNDGGLYTPENNNISFLIEATPLEHEKYFLNQTGLSIDIYSEIRRTVSTFSHLKSANALQLVMAGIYKKENKLDDLILLNEQGYMVEAISSNLFIIKGKEMYTPPLSDGCIDGIMRRQIIDIAREKNIIDVEEISILPEGLPDSEEIFLTNAVSGIRWVVAHKNRRFFNTITKKLLIALNEKAF